MAMITEGAFGKRDGHFVNSNFFLGSFEKIMQGIVPTIRWHSVLQYVFLFVGLTLLTYVIVHYRNGKLVSVIVLLATGYETYVSLQFTKTTAILAGGCLLTLLLIIKDYLEDTHIFDNKKEKKAIIVVSIIVFMYSCLLRYESVAIVICILGPIGFINMIRFIIKNKQDKRWTIYFKCFLPLLAFLALIPISNKLVYLSSEEWIAFTDFDQARGLIVDRRYDAFDYNQNAESLKAVGVSANDAEMYLTYMFPDTEEISADDIRNIIAAQPPKKIGIRMMKEWVKNIYDTYFVLSALVIGVVLLFGIVLVKHKKKVVLECLVSVAIMGIILAYFQYSGRWSHRLTYAVLIAELISAIYLLVDIKEEERTKELYSIVLIVLLFCVIGQWLGNRFDYNAYMRRRETVDYDILQTYLTENKDILFCADTFTLQDAFKYKVFTPMQEGDWQNLVECGSWIFNSPIVNNQLAQFEYANPVQALKSCNDNVRLIDNNSPEKKMLYLKEHGNGYEYSAELVENIGGYNIYQVN